ncbi:YceI family protein [Pseudoalteromonas sp. T1lg76]|uniref:YceI family protein n=1 Tax=Pseudoalteromonas sp. T1lg76 TaxID=2077103 RepID=UPI0022791603|nr:YceI family protein [Pseudoalteromonas sp. T1lg76]
MNKALTKLTLAAAMMAASGAASAADYVIDTQGAHAFVNFKIQHLGYSWLHGRFNTFSGDFSYDAQKPNESKIKVVIDTASIDSNHAERDKHLRSGDFLNVKKHPTATFTSTNIEFTDADNAKVSGEFTLNGVTKPISFDVTKVGEGKDPWGGYRAGFSGHTRFALADYGIDQDLGPASTHVEIELSIEGVRK